jgi:hypothetical protein
MLLRDTIRQLAGTQFDDAVSSVMAQVVSVDIDTATCVCQLIGGVTTAELKTVNLMAENDDGLLLVPAVGSTVIVIWTKRMLPFVAMFSEISDVYLNASGVVEINQGTYGGLVKVQDLVTKMNAIENKLNSIIASYNAHIHPDPVSGSTGVPTVPITGTLTPTIVADIENPNVTHG